jgi:hypothetical protein
LDRAHSPSSGGIGNEPAPYEGIADDANKWIFVHFAQLVLTPLVAVGVWLLLDGVYSVAATIARASLVVWMVFFSAFDAIAGIAVGVLTRYANSLAGNEQEAVIGAIDFLFQDSKFVGGNNYSVLAGFGQVSWVVLVRRHCGAVAGRRLSACRRSDPDLFPLRYPCRLHGSGWAGSPLRRRALYVPSAACSVSCGAAPRLDRAAGRKDTLRLPCPRPGESQPTAKRCRCLDGRFRRRWMPLDSTLLR